MSTHTITLTVNGREHTEEVEARLTLADLLRERLDLTATHLGCEHGVCGACTVLLDGKPARSCLTLAVQAEGAKIRTLEGLADPKGELHPVQQGFWEKHGMQCGFCTPGIVMSVVELLERNPDPSDDEIAATLGGHLCRCTGYVKIREAVREAVRLRSGSHSPQEIRR
jgi:carbon-monoxide dehydrogenase small subunit